MPINFPSNPNNSDTYTSAGTTWIYDGSVWNVVSSSTVINIPSNDTFQNVAVSGQSTVVADSSTDTLNLVAGSNITITTDASTDSVTINSTASGGSASNSFANIAVSGQNTVVADSSNDTLNLTAGSGITITTDNGTDTITITNSQSAGVTTFATLTDAISAGLTVDEIYLPAITSLTVTNSGAIAYLFDQYAGNNPQIYAINGTTIAFKLNASGHPFLIQTNTGSNYNTGLVHVSTSGTVTTGASAQGKDSGTLYWKIPSDISGNYRYQCSVHGAMIGTITIKNFGSI
jgi:plastocyanin